MYTVRTKPSTEYEAVETAPHFEEWKIQKSVAKMLHFWGSNVNKETLSTSRQGPQYQTF
jgi:hypothetical protein